MSLSSLVCEPRGTGTDSSVSSRPGRGVGEALGAAAPVDHLGLVDLEARVVGGGQARRGTDGAVDVHHAAAERQIRWWWLSPVRSS